MSRRPIRYLARRHLHGIARLVASMLLIFSCSSVMAAPLRIAVSANFKSTLETLVAAYTASGSGNTLESAEQPEQPRIDIIAGATGALYAQIVNGAPYDILLAADRLRPTLLVEAGLASSKGHFIYATGQLVFWVPGGITPVTAATFMATNSPIAIANPALAPYGLAAKSVIDQLKPGHQALVYGNNINQAFQFVESGNAAAGFVALSQVQTRSTPGNWWLIPANLYPAIHQEAVVLKDASQAAWQFADWLRSAAAQQIIREAGYLTPAGP